MNQSSVIKLNIKEEVLNAVLGKEYILSTSIVGSFLTSSDLSGISDIDVIIIVDELSEFKFKKIIDSFQQISVKSIGLDEYNVKVNSTFGPLKFNTDKNIVFHVMIYDTKGHIKHVEESPFTCHSWENFSPILGYSLSDIYPVLNLQLSDVLNSRRGLFSYLEDVENGEITYRKYEFINKEAHVIKDKFKLDSRHKLEYSYHITFHLLNNFYKIISGAKNSLEPHELILFFQELNFLSKSDRLFFLELYEWKKKSGQTPKHLISSTKNFILNFFNSINILSEASTSISFYRHAKTDLNDGTFLGVRRNPSIIKVSKIYNDELFDVAYHSELKRSKETLKYFKFKKHHEASLINEIDYGLAEGLTLNQLSDKFPEVVRSWADGEDPRFPEGENQQDVLNRIEEFFKQFVFNKKALVITHLVTLRMILAKCLYMDFKNLYKIKINHLEKFDIINYKNFKFLDIPSDLRTQIRKQLSLQDA